MMWRRKSLPMISLIFWKLRACRPVRSGWNLGGFGWCKTVLCAKSCATPHGARRTNYGLQPFCDSTGADAGCHADELSGKNLGRCAWNAA